MPTRIKICGVTTAADAEMAVRHGADAVGLNFYSGSPRCVQSARAREILSFLPPFVEPVAVLVSPTQAEIRACLLDCGIRTIQLHAARPGDISATPAAANGRVILASGVNSQDGLDESQAMIATWRTAGVSPAALLVDAKVPGMHGGTGKTAPWSLLADFKLDVPIILAGGLTAENVADAIRIVRPYAVDVASGVEKAAGVKDEETVRRFIDAVREAG